MIAPERALVLWNTNRDMRITGLRIIDRDHVDTTFAFSGGACWSDWMKPGKAGQTPLGLFVRLSANYGFVNSWVAREALWQFSCVKGQAWALEAWMADEEAA